MPSSIELNIGHVPSPRRRRGAAEDGDDDGVPPFRVVVLGDFSGRPAAEREALGERRPLRVDVDNFEAVFARIAPTALIAGLQDKLGIQLRIALATMDEFSADAVFARLPAHSLAALAPTVAAAVVAPPATAPTADAPGAEDADATLRRLLGGSVPDTAPARAAAPAPKHDEAVDRFIRQLVGAAPVAPQPAAPAPAGSDAAAAALLRHVLRDPQWRHLESAWRAVDRFVRQLDMADGHVRLELLDCRADELLADLVACAGDAARSALKPALHGDGRGCALLVSLEEFGPGVTELSLLGGLAATAAAHDAVLIAGAAPALAAVATSEDAQVLATPGARVWTALRASAVAARIGLTFPRLLARLPYGPRNEPVSAFAFDELADLGGDALHGGLLWRSAALDAALLLAQGVDDDGGDAGVESRVQLEDLPAFIDRSGDEPRLQAVAETYLGERDVNVLQSAGLMALQSDRRVPHARVSGWQSIAAGGGALAGRWRAV
ncbi:MAG: type VI secretion system contractile sheath large subunit [Betaproteobacteria bacterium]